MMKKKHAFLHWAFLMMLALGAPGLQAQVGVFFTSLIGGCQCADDPMPLEPLPEYAQIEVTIQRETGMACLRLLD